MQIVCTVEPVKVSDALLLVAVNVIDTEGLRTLFVVGWSVLTFGHSAAGELTGTESAELNEYKSGIAPGTE